MENHTIICGYGRIAQVMANQLAKSERTFLIIDNDPHRVALAEERGFLVKAGDATDEDILEAVGINQAGVLATVLPDDSTNVFIALTARELNPNLLIIARSNLPSTEKKLRLAGANHIISPATVSGVQMANLITRPTSNNFLEEKDRHSSLNDLLAQIDVRLEELTIALGSSLGGKTIGELEIRGKGAFILVALRRSSGELITHLHSSLILNAQDTLIVLGHQEKLPKFARYYQLSHSLHQRQKTQSISY